MEKNLYPTDVVFTREVCSEQQIEKEDEEDCLDENPEGLDDPVLFRPFFFQFLISPG